MTKLRVFEVEAILEELFQRVNWLMDRSWELGVDPERVVTTVEEVAVNLKPPAKKRGQKRGRSS